MEPFLAAGDLNTDLIGFDKTVSNNPSRSSDGKRKLTSNQNVAAIPVFDSRYYEAYDICVVFPVKFNNVGMAENVGLKHKGDSVVPMRKREKIVMRICKGRAGGKQYNKVSSLKDHYGINDSDLKNPNLTWNELLNIIKKSFRNTLNYGNFKYSEELSQDKKMIIFRVKLSEDACKKISDIKNYPLQMDSAVTHFQQFKDDPKFVAPFAPYERKYEKTEREGSAMQLLGHIWQRYDRLSRPYNSSDIHRHDKELSIFRDIDRVKIASIFFDGFFNLHWAKKYGMVSTFYATHQPTTLISLRNEWGNLTKFYTWKQPLDSVRNYFGEETALYYAWLGQLCKSLTIPASFGLVLFVLECCFDWEMKYESLYLNVFRLMYCIMLAGWSTFFYKKWSRKENDLKIKWGLDVITGNKVSSSANPWHKPNCTVEDPVTPLNTVEGTTKAQLITRKTITTTAVVVITLLTIMILNREGTYALLRSINLIGKDTQYFDKWLGEKIRPLIGDELADKIAKNTYLVFLPLVISIKIMEKLWDSYIVPAMSKFENEPFYKQYMGSLVKKSYGFKFILNAFPLIYFVFLKHQFFDDINSAEDTSIATGIISARKLMMTLVVVRMVSNVVEIGLPLLMEYIKTYSKKATLASTPYYEKQMYKSTYKDTHHLKDFQEMMLNYALIALFGSVFSLIPLLTLLTAMIELRCDAFKLTRSFQRVWPNQIEDTGIWGEVLNGLSLGSTVVNTLLVGLVTVGYTFEPVMKLTTAIIALIIVLCFKEFLTVMVPLESKNYRTQKARSHIVMYEAIWGHSGAVQKPIK